jgi:hypothetical protein
LPQGLKFSPFFFRKQGRRRGDDEAHNRQEMLTYSITMTVRTVLLEAYIQGCP